jgi:hypothetical protein
MSLLQLRGRREGRVSADTHGPRATKKHAAEPQVQPEQPAFPAQWFYGLYVIFPVTGLSCHRHSWIVSTTLAPASGRQNHTISPSAIASFVRAMIAPELSRPSHPASYVRDDRETPLMWERDGDSYKFDLGSSRSDLFSRDGLDRFSQSDVICPSCSHTTHHALVSNEMRPTALLLNIVAVTYVFLAPILIALRWASPKQTAALSAPFILANSAVGLAGAMVTGQKSPLRLGSTQLRLWLARRSAR